MSINRCVRKSWALVVAGVSAVAFAAGCVAPSAGLGAGPPKCFSSQLLLKFVSFEGATGARFWQMAFENVSSPCTLRGFPAVQLLDRHGHVIHKSIGHWNLVPVKTVTLGMNKRAFFAFRYTDGGFCPGRSFRAYRFKFAPPQRNAAFVFNPIPKNHGVPSLCTGSMRVTAVSSKKL